MLHRELSNLGCPVSNTVLNAFRGNRHRVFTSMTELCSCALSECRIFQALVHNGTIIREGDYEEYVSPPCAFLREDMDGLFEDLVHQSIDMEIGSENVACDLGIDSMENGFSVSMLTMAGNVLVLQVSVEEIDIHEDLMKQACLAAKDIGFHEGEDPANGTYCFLSCRCMVNQIETNSSDEEEEAETTDEDSNDEDYVPSEQSEDTEDENQEEQDQAKKLPVRPTKKPRN